ncbi:MAG: phospholipase [Planctomycetes bacterium]|nr:phospholipase [Planctomycetota bacterium]
MESGSLTAPYSLAALRGTLGTVNVSADVLEALVALEDLRCPGPAIAAWIRSHEQAAARMTKPDLVWSGPEVPGVHARDTRRVYEELLSSARRTLWASTFVFFDGPRAFEILARRMDEVPELHVKLLLNIQRPRGDDRDPEQVVRSFRERFWNRDWPGSRRPAVFYDPRSLEQPWPSGVLHAKAVVADEEAVFITSANLTEAALDRNFEMGLLVRDRALGASVASHFVRLIESGVLRRLPGGELGSEDELDRK